MDAILRAHNTGMPKIGESWNHKIYDEDDGNLIETVRLKFAKVLNNHRIIISKSFIECPFDLTQTPKYQKLIEEAKKGKADYSAEYFWIEEEWVQEERWKEHMEEAEEFLKKHPSGEWINEKRRKEITEIRIRKLDDGYEYDLFRDKKLSGGVKGLTGFELIKAVVVKIERWEKEGK